MSLFLHSLRSTGNDTTYNQNNNESATGKQYTVPVPLLQ